MQLKRNLTSPLEMELSTPLFLLSLTVNTLNRKSHQASRTKFGIDCRILQRKSYWCHFFHIFYDFKDKLNMVNTFLAGRCILFWRIVALKGLLSGLKIAASDLSSCRPWIKVLHKFVTCAQKLFLRQFNLRCIPKDLLYTDRRCYFLFCSVLQDIL